MSIADYGFENFIVSFQDSSYSFNVYPQGNFQESHTVKKNLSRSINGTIHAYRVANSINYSFNFNLSFVNSSDAFRINDLWTNQYPFTFALQNANDRFEYNCVIQNQNKPLSSRVNNNFNLFKGNLNIVSTDNQEMTVPNSATPFIFDDPTLGTFDGLFGRL